MIDVSGVVFYFYNIHKELHGRDGYDRRYVMRDIEGELKSEDIEYDEMMIHCMLDELEDDYN